MAIPMPRLSCLAALLTCAFANGAAAGNSVVPGGGVNRAPHWLGPVSVAEYDGVSDDLLTAGLGKSGLGMALSTAGLDPNKPADLRKLAIHTNYRALVDPTANGGYGRLYGPNIDINGNDTLGEGKIAGAEYLAYADKGGDAVTLMVQVPAHFDPADACIVTATSSGSRGVYGAIGTSGEWGLKRGCAVAYADKGTGTGAHDLQSNTVYVLNGVRTDATVAGDDSIFTAPLSALQRQQFNAETPNRLAFKHAHSQRNPEKDWGRDTLRAIEFAFYVLNERFGSKNGAGKTMRSIVPNNTIVIASSVSNGGGAALAAAEQDRHGLIDGVAVSEPNIQIDPKRNPVIRRGSLTYTEGSKPLLDYFTFANLYQPCAALAPAAAAGPLALPPALVPLATNRCASLAAKGLLTATDTASQAAESLNKLLAFGWEPDTIPLQVSHWRFATPAIAMTYSNTHGRFSVADNLCGLSFASTDAGGAPVATSAGVLNLLFGTSNGVPPTSGINIVNNNSVGGPRLDTLSVSPSTGQADFNIDGAICQRKLVTGHDVDAWRVRFGIQEVQQTADLNRKPAIIVHGRADTLVPINFSSRPYFAENQRREGRKSNLRYVEVTNGQHFDAFLPFPGYDTSYIPMHVYFNRALDLMYAHLKSGAPLPGSQVVRTTPRGGSPGSAPALTSANVPPIAIVPASANAITYADGVLTIPD